MRIIIIGGVAGGATAAARLRRLDEQAEIILFERGEYISFANCGLPYHVGGVINKRESLLLLTPERMKRRFNIDVRIHTEITSINRREKTVTATGLDGEYTLCYDKLVISTGSSPLRPNIPGIDSPRILTLWTVPDADTIRRMMESSNVRNATIVGGGFIGLEMAENLRVLGLDVTIVEMQDQVLAPLDYEMAQLIHGELKRSGVALQLGDGVQAFEDNGEYVGVRLSSGRVMQTEMVILSIGVRPNSGLAAQAGLELNQRGGIIVDEYLRTSDPDIYAVGDVVETIDFPGHNRAMVPLAGPANKQGRIAANNIAGMQDVYNGAQRTAIAKVFDMVAASTGNSEKDLIIRGMVEGKDYHKIWVMQKSHAGYYPGAKEMAIKLVFTSMGSLLGAQVVGEQGVDKCIDILATALRLGATVHDLTKLDLAYAPPFSSAKSPVNMAGYVAENVLNGLVKMASWDAVERLPEGYILLDIRESAELAYTAIEGAVNIPMGQLRERLDELNKDDGILIICAAGVRAHTAARLLMNSGFNDVSIYPGGMGFYLATHHE